MTGAELDSFGTALTAVEAACAPVYEFRLSEQNLQAGVLSGFAAPQGGTKPCGVFICGGGEVFAVAKATGYSGDARDAGQRLGWCGFQIGGVSQCVALAHDFEIRCVVSNRVLKRWDSAAVVDTMATNLKRINVMGLLAAARAESGCHDVRQVVPFGLDLVMKRGAIDFARASYRYILDRDIDQDAVDAFSDNLLDGKSVEGYWKMLLKSVEYRSKWRHCPLGPFEPGFPFPLDPLLTPGLWDYSM